MSRKALVQERGLDFTPPSFADPANPFGRSVSSSEPSSQIHDKLSSDGVPSVFFHNSCPTNSNVSPSPLSSTATTISPESPNRNAVFPVNDVAHPATTSISDETPYQNDVSDSSLDVSNQRPSFGSPVKGDDYLTTSDDISQLPALLSDPSSHKTLSLFVSLVDSRLVQNWRSPLLRQLSERDKPQVSAVSPDAESASKRIRCDSEAVPQSSPQFNNSVSHTLLKSCLERLTDRFEERYRAKLGDLLNDVAQLSNSDSSPQGSPRQHYHAVLKELFTEKVGWGRLVAMLAFLRALAEVVDRAPSDALDSTDSGEFSTESPQQLSEKSPLVSPAGNQNSRIVSPTAAHYVVWTAEFVHQPISAESRSVWHWISANGGWEGLLTFESERMSGSQQLNADGMGALGAGLSDDELFGLMRRALTGAATVVVGAVGLLAAIRYFRQFK